MATQKKGRDYPLSPTPAPTDSTAYYSNLSKKYFDAAASVRNAPYDGRLIKEQSKERLQKENEYNQKALEAIDNQLRQSRKGKPGYDKNGFPIKK
jgi:hypothetical protein